MSVEGSAVASSGGRRAAVALVLLLTGVVSGWIGVGLVAENGACDNEGHCPFLTRSAGTSRGSRSRPQASVPLPCSPPSPYSL
jgi:hypothetical protein